VVGKFCPGRVRTYGFKAISGKDFERVWKIPSNKTKTNGDLVNKIFIFACIIPFHL